jgi:hypothetical protein
VPPWLHHLYAVIFTAACGAAWLAGLMRNRRVVCGFLGAAHCGQSFGEQSSRVFARLLFFAQLPLEIFHARLQSRALGLRLPQQGCLVGEPITELALELLSGLLALNALLLFLGEPRLKLV